MIHGRSSATPNYTSSVISPIKISESALRAKPHLHLNHYYHCCYYYYFINNNSNNNNNSNGLGEDRRMLRLICISVMNGASWQSWADVVVVMVVMLMTPEVLGRPPPSKSQVWYILPKGLARVAHQPSSPPLRNLSTIEADPNS